MSTEQPGRGSSRDREDDDVTVRSLTDLDQDVMNLDVHAAEAQLRAEERWQTTGRNAVTLIKYPNLRVVLEVLRPGTRIEDRRPETAGRVALQILSGRIRVAVGGRDLDLPAGRLLALDRFVPERIDALEESAFLYWVSWPEGAQAT
jgi:quercetin dioxygenase-like cupin family protein